MQRLRQARVLARLVLAWFALSIGVAVAAPMVQPQAAQWLCSGAGMKLVLPDGGNEAVPTLDCPLCASLVAPGPTATAWAAHPILACVAAWAPDPVQVATAAPAPARGPPASA